MPTTVASTGTDISPAALRAARLVTRPNVTAGVAYAVNAFLDGRLDLLSPGGRA